MAISEEREAELNRLWESYFIPGTETLKNKLGITDPDELKEREAEITFEKLVELYENPIEGNFDKEHWIKIHRYLFEDIYDWAGEFRYVDMMKETGFTHHENIETYLTEELRLMNEVLRNVRNKYSLALLLAEYYVHLMAIHPFREGNGRSCREFLRELVIYKSQEFADGPLEIDWTKFDGEVVLESLKFSMVFRGAIEQEFMKCLVPVEKENNQQIKM